MMFIFMNERSFTRFLDILNDWIKANCNGLVWPFKLHFSSKMGASAIHMTEISRIKVYSLRGIRLLG